MLKYTLYGDGIHDDTAAIQEMIDSGVCEVSLPAPEKCYLISKPLVIPSNFKLKLPRYTIICSLLLLKRYWSLIISAAIRLIVGFGCVRK